MTAETDKIPSRFFSAAFVETRESRYAVGTSGRFYEELGGDGEAFTDAVCFLGHFGGSKQARKSLGYTEDDLRRKREEADEILQRKFGFSLEELSRGCKTTARKIGEQTDPIAYMTELGIEIIRTKEQLEEQERRPGRDSEEAFADWKKRFNIQ